LADLTGELMRYAIQIVSSGKYDRAMTICKTLRDIDDGKKMNTGICFLF